MKQLFRKQVRIFGRTIPLVVILALVLVVGAAGAWLVSYLGHMQGTPAAVAVHYDGDGDCVVTAGIGSCSMADGGVNNPRALTVSGFGPGTVVAFSNLIHNAGTQPACFQSFDAPMPVGASLVLTDAIVRPGLTLPPTTSGSARVWLQLSFSNEYDASQPFAADWSTTFALGACPP